MKLGQKIKDLRKEKQISQKDLGLSIGVSQTAVYTWECDINEPTATYIKRLADFFEVTTDYLLSDED